MPSQYPRNLRLDDSTEMSLRTFLNERIFNLRAERGAYINLLKDYQKIYWAEPKEGKNKFPFTGAAKVVIPISAISIETIHAKNMTTLFGLGDIIQCKAELPEFVPIQEKYTRWFNKELFNNVGIKQFAKNTDLERVKYGNCIGRVSYLYEEKQAIQSDDNGNEKEVTVITKNGAIAEAVSVARFIMPFTDVNPQDAILVGEEVEVTRNQLELWEQSGKFIPGTIDKIKAFFANPAALTGKTGHEFLREQQELEKKVPSPMIPNMILYYHIWMSFNVDGNEEGKTKEIVLDYHYESNTIMSIRYNWYDDLHRPYRIGQYFPIEHRWTGIGVCKQLMEFQKEITIQHRQRIDNATLANTKMIKVSKLSGYGPNEPIFPGKMWFVDEMDHIDTLEMGEIYASSFNNEQSTLMYAQQRSGVNELTVGMEQSGTPGTATDILARSQEAKGKAAYYFENFKDFIHEIVLDTACVLQQYGPKDIEILDRNPDGGLIKQIMRMPERYVRQGLLYKLNVVGQNDNKLADRNNMLQLVQILQQYWQGQVQIAEMLQSPQLLQMIGLRALTSTTEAMKQILETFDLRDIDHLIVMEELTNGISQLLGPGTSGGSPNNIPATPNSGVSNPVPPPTPASPQGI